jgi:hypothetical protein
MAPKVRPQSSEDEFDPDGAFEPSEAIPQIYPNATQTANPDIDLDIISLPGQSKKSQKSQMSRKSNGRNSNGSSKNLKNKKYQVKDFQYSPGGEKLSPGGNQWADGTHATAEPSPATGNNPSASANTAHRKMSSWSGSSKCPLGIIQLW